MCMTCLLQRGVGWRFAASGTQPHFTAMSVWTVAGSHLTSCLWVSVALSLGIRQPDREVGYLSPCGEGVKNAWNYRPTPTSPLLFAGWCLVGQSDSCSNNMEKWRYGRSLWEIFLLRLEFCVIPRSKTREQASIIMKEWTLCITVCNFWNIRVTWHVHVKTVDAALSEFTDSVFKQAMRK
jgi:hypothetical protein